MTDINKKLLPPSMIDEYKEILAQNGLSLENASDIPDGICVVNDDGSQAFVCMDGRYPHLKDGYSLNQICTETITVLKGDIVLKISGDIHLLQQGQTYPITPGNKYSITGVVIAKVDISPNRDSQQNSFVQL